MMDKSYNNKCWTCRSKGGTFYHVCGYAKSLKILERNTPKHFENFENKFKLKPQLFILRMIPIYKN